MPNSIIELKDIRLTLTSRAGPVEILRDVSLDIVAGQSTAIVGPSGSGKTSLLMVMAGLEQATAGAVVVNGRNIAGLSEDDLAVLRGQDIGIVFQSFHLVPTMTALENVALPLELAGVADAFVTARALLDDVGLGSRVDHFPAQLSGGEQQRVAIARAVANAPLVLLADEPTGNLDPVTASYVFEALSALVKQSGLAALIATHNHELAKRMDRRVTLADGHIVPF